VGSIVWFLLHRRSEIGTGLEELDTTCVTGGASLCFLSDFCDSNSMQRKAAHRVALVTVI